MLCQKFRRGVEQLVARRAHNPEVAGSNPAPATIFFNTECGTHGARHIRRPITISGGGVAQMVRAHGSYPCCHWFESSRRYHSIMVPAGYVLAVQLNKLLLGAPLAQMVEQLTLNPAGRGEDRIPARSMFCSQIATIYRQHLMF